MSRGMEHPDRRAFLAVAGAGLAATAAAWPVQAGARLQDRSADEFAAARRSDPRLVAFENGHETDLARLRIEGTMPAELSGLFHRNGPAVFERAGVRYRHWFDGDGFIQRWRIENGSVRYRSRFIQTSKFKLEEPAGAFLLPAGGGGIPPVAPYSGSNSANPSNTSIIAMGLESWALWEGGSAMRIDPETLDTLGLVRFDSEVDGAPFSAHPAGEGKTGGSGTSARSASVSCSGGWIGRGRSSGSRSSLSGRWDTITTSF